MEFVFLKNHYRIVKINFWVTAESAADTQLN